MISHVGGFGNLLTYTEGRADIFHNMFGGWFWGIAGVVIAVPTLLASKGARAWRQVASDVGAGANRILGSGR